MPQQAKIWIWLLVCFIRFHQRSQLISLTAEVQLYRIDLKSNSHYLFLNPCHTFWWVVLDLSSRSKIRLLG
jgi:hypothetical protein